MTVYHIVMVQRTDHRILGVNTAVYKVGASCDLPIRSAGWSTVDVQKVDLDHARTVYRRGVGLYEDTSTGVFVEEDKVCKNCRRRDRDREHRLLRQLREAV